MDLFLKSQKSVMFDSIFYFEISESYDIAYFCMHFTMFVMWSITWTYANQFQNKKTFSNIQKQSMKVDSVYWFCWKIIIKFWTPKICITNSLILDLKFKGWIPWEIFHLFIMLFFGCFDLIKLIWGKPHDPPPPQHHHQSSNKKTEYCCKWWSSPLIFQ